jgi:hypothetical protein
MRTESKERTPRRLLESSGAGRNEQEERWPVHSMEAELTIGKFLVEKSRLGLSPNKRNR